MVAADARTAIAFAFSPGNSQDATEGRELLWQLPRMPEGLPLILIVPPKSNRVDPWTYDRSLYTKRNEIERLIRRLKGLRRIFSRFEKLDVLFLGFLHFALIVEALR